MYTRVSSKNTVAREDKTVANTANTLDRTIMQYMTARNTECTQRRTKKENQRTFQFK